jgi:hypothetical protein
MLSGFYQVLVVLTATAMDFEGSEIACVVGIIAFVPLAFWEILIDTRTALLDQVFHRFDSWNLIFNMVTMGISLPFSTNENPKEHIAFFTLCIMALLSAVFMFVWADARSSSLSVKERNAFISSAILATCTIAVGLTFVTFQLGIWSDRRLTGGTNYQALPTEVLTYWSPRATYGSAYLNLGLLCARVVLNSMMNSYGSKSTCSTVNLHSTFVREEVTVY